MTGVRPPGIPHVLVLFVVLGKFHVEDENENDEEDDFEER
jgi:hypothetical protein